MANNDRNRNVLDTDGLAAIAASITPVSGQLSTERKDAMRATLLARVDPPPPPGTRTVRAEKRQWINIAPLVEMKILRRDDEQNNQTVLLRLQPNAVLHGHPHTLEEECLVLEGEISIGGHVIRQGDMHIAEPGCEHPDLTTAAGALLMVRSEIHAAPAATPDR